MVVAKQRVTDAVNFLIASDQYGRLIREITDIIERWNVRPMAFAGKLECLNAMIDVGVENREAFERLVELIEQKRSILPEIRRVDYQRKIMQDRRARQGRAIELHELVTGKPITGTERAKFIKDLQARWRKERDAFIAGKGELSWSDRNDAANEFWDLVDAKLDQNLKDAAAKKKAKG